MKMWHVPDLRSEQTPDDGWVVLAEDPAVARALVIAEREQAWRDSLRADRERNWPDAFWRNHSEEEFRKWYFTGAAYQGKGTPDPDTFVGEPVEIGPVFTIPFLGYSW